MPTVLRLARLRSKAARNSTKAMSPTSTASMRRPAQAIAALIVVVTAVEIVADAAVVPAAEVAVIVVAATDAVATAEVTAATVVMAVAGTRPSGQQLKYRVIPNPGLPG
jgi:hypothetical protein